MEPPSKRICGDKFQYSKQPLRKVRDEVSVLLKHASIFSGMTVHHEGDADNTTFVARKDGVIIGVCLCSVEENMMNSAILYINKKWRRRGVGTALIKKALEGKTSLMGKVYDHGAMQTALEQKKKKEYEKEEKDKDDNNGVNVFLFCKSIGAHVTYKEEFNFIWTLISPTAKFVRLMTPSEEHKNYQFQDGLNVLKVADADFYRLHDGPGLYFCTPRDIKRWLAYFNPKSGEDDRMAWVREVSLPPDAKVIRSAKDAFKADKIVLGKRMAIPDWLAENV
jgi:hypothetical protein